MGAEPVECLADEFFERLTPVVAGDRLVQVPPHPFDRVRLRSILR